MTDKFKQYNPNEVHVEIAGQKLYGYENLNNIGEIMSQKIEIIRRGIIENNVCRLSHLNTGDFFEIVGRADLFIFMIPHGVGILCKNITKNREDIIPSSMPVLEVESVKIEYKSKQPDSL